MEGPPVYAVRSLAWTPGASPSATPVWAPQLPSAPRFWCSTLDRRRLAFPGDLLKINSFKKTLLPCLVPSEESTCGPRRHSHGSISHSISPSQAWSLLPATRCPAWHLGATLPATASLVLFWVSCCWLLLSPPSQYWGVQGPPPPTVTSRRTGALRPTMVPSLTPTPAWSSFLGPCSLYSAAGGLTLGLLVLHAPPPDSHVPLRLLLHVFLSPVGAPLCAPCRPSLGRCRLLFPCRACRLALSVTWGTTVLPGGLEQPPCCSLSPSSRRSRETQ